MKRTLIALALAAVLPFSAQAAEDLSYSYIEGDYVNLDGDADGFGVRGSVNFGASNFYGLASYSNTNFDYDDAYDSYDYDYDIDTFEIGVGFHHSVSDKADLIAELAYDNISFDTDSVDDIDGDETDGFRASVGFRGALAPKFEGLIKLNYINSLDDDNNDISSSDGDDDGDFSATIGGQIKLNQTWGLTGEFTFADDYNTYLLGVRASF